MNVVIIGSSHSHMDGIPAGFKELGWNVNTLSVNASPTVFVLHKICDFRNLKLLKEADLIFCESNDFDHSLDTNLSCADIIKTYKQLYLLKKKVIIILFPHPYKKFPQENFIKQKKITDNFHIFLANYYGFNVIDLRVVKQELYDFAKSDSLHLNTPILKKFGKNIAQQFKNLNYPKAINLINIAEDFTVCHIDEMITSNNYKKQCIEVTTLGNIVNVLKIDNNFEIYFPKKYYDWYIYSIFSHNLNNILYSSVTIERENETYNTLLYPGSAVKRLSKFIKIEKKLKLKCNGNLNGDMDKIIPYEKPKTNKYLNYVGLISFLLVKNYNEEEIDFESLAKDNIEINKEYNFNHLIPPLEWYKEIIDEYCNRVDPIKSAPLKNQINALKIQLSNIHTNSAKARIQNQLSYKLGQAMIENSKSILGYIRMPYVLSYIKDKHKQEQKIYEEKIKKDPSLKLPPLESYPDYKEALKFKEHLSYKLGEALIKASRNWYKGGYLKLFFEIRKLRKEFKKKKA